MDPYRTMKELPETEQPYEKCLLTGPSGLSDAELLAVLLRCGTPGETAGDLARRLLVKLHEHGGLRALTYMSVEQLKECRGIGTVKAIQLQCMSELGIRLCRENARERVAMRTAGSIADFFMEDLCNRRQECVVAAFFNTKGHLMHSSMITRGTVNASLVSPREVYLEALAWHAVYVIILHNHPSGDPTPSEDDLQITDELYESGKILGIPLIDHIIIGDHCYISLKEQGLIP